MKREVIILLSALILTVNFASAFHMASEFKIITSSGEMTLQEAIDNNEFHKLGNTYADVTINPINNHKLTDIWISAKGRENTFFNELQAPNPRITGGSTSYVSQPTTQTQFHFAAQIIFDDGRSLQDLILANETCARDTYNSLGISCGADISDGCGGILETRNCPGGEYCDNGACEAECTPGQTRTAICTEPDPNECTTYSGATQTCMANENWGDPVCIEEYLDRGTMCSTGTCDGTGLCENYTGIGCDDCPWGIRILPRRAVCDIDTNSYWAKYLEFVHDTGNFYFPIFDDWTEFDNKDPVCQRKTCTNARFYFCRGEEYYNDTTWQISPLGCLPSCDAPNEVLCGTVNTDDNGCGTPCNVPGTYCEDVWPNPDVRPICVDGTWCCGSYCETYSDEFACGEPGVELNYCQQPCNVIGSDCGIGSTSFDCHYDEGGVGYNCEGYGTSIRFLD